MSRACDAIRVALADFGECVETLDGARIATHCLYPSHETVHVYVVHEGSEFRVHDGGAAYKCAWTHGREEKGVWRAIEHYAAAYHLHCKDDVISSPLVSAEWLSSAILAVANASALGASRALEKANASSERDLAIRIESALLSKFGQSAVAKEYGVVGRSGGLRRFDFAVRRGGEYELLVNAVTPFRASVNSKFVAFSDTEHDLRYKFAVYGDRLETSDVALLETVSSLVPIGALAAGAEKVLAYAQ